MLLTQGIAGLFHIGAQAVRYLAREHDDFPAPVLTIRVRGMNVRVWAREDVEAWGTPRGYLGRGARAAARRNTEPASAAPAAAAGPRYVTPTRPARHYALRAQGLN